MSTTRTEYAYTFHGGMPNTGGYKSAAEVQAFIDERVKQGPAYDGKSANPEDFKIVTRMVTYSEWVPVE